MSKKTIGIPIELDFYKHLETMCEIQSSIDNRKVSLSEICRKMLIAQSGYGKKKFCTETLTLVETIATDELKRLYKPKIQKEFNFKDLQLKEETL